METTGDLSGDVTQFHPLGLAAVLVLGLSILSVPRRFTVIPMFIMACYISSAQRIVIVGFDFDMLRILIAFGMIRVLLRGELTEVKWKPIDGVFLAWAIVFATSFVLLHKAPWAAINRIGFLYNAIGFYFIFRSVVCEDEDIQTLVEAIVFIAIPVAIFFTIEKLTARNAFSLFGGVPQFTEMREGKRRCQGAFSHPILAGVFWAAVLPWLYAYALQTGNRLKAAIGTICCFVVIFACASSTPIMGVGLGWMGMGAFWFRKYIPKLLVLTVLAGTAMHFAMRQPIWHLMARIDLVGGSTGYHRYHLFDKFIHYWKEWFWLGTKSTAHWGWGLFDITNQYVLMGVRGGILSLMLFLLLVGMGFYGLWKHVHLLEGQPKRQILGWGIMTSLFVHSVIFMAVSYFGQIYFLWYLQLAIAGSLYPTGETVALTCTERPQTPAAAKPQRITTPWRTPDRGITSANPWHGGSA